VPGRAARADPAKHRSPDLRQGQRAVIVAVIPVRVMQVSVDQVVDVVSVRHCLVPASRTMQMRAVMPAAPVLGRAPVRIGRRHIDAVLVHVILVHVVHMTVVEVVDVIAMANGGMPALGTVLMGVVGVLGAGAHRETSMLSGARHLLAVVLPLSLVGI
jgi:hypothetical protein